MSKKIFSLITFIALSMPFALVLANSKTIEMSITEKGFEPSSIDVSPGTHLTLLMTRKTDLTCATKIIVPQKKIKKDLPLNKTISVALGKLEKGEVRFGCDMNMMVGGKIIIK